MIESAQTTNPFRPFEGMWLMTKPSGAIACAKIIGENLLIPYSFGSERKLTGHHHGFQVIGKTLFGRFEQFDSARAGVFFLTVEPNETLTGGRWMDEHVSEAAQKDISSLSGSLPGMQATVWVRMRLQTPEWAEKYFSEDWPNKLF